VAEQPKPSVEHRQLIKVQQHAENPITEGMNPGPQTLVINHALISAGVAGVWARHRDQA
jgi:hypothetical protein